MYDFGCTHFLILEGSSLSIITCPKCGKTIYNAVNYCPNCGNQIYINNVSYTSNIQRKFSKKPIIICTCIGVFILFIALLNWMDINNSNYSSNYNYTSNGIYGSSSNHPSIKTDDSSIFRNLKISNFSASLGKHGGKMTCQVLNNNSFTVSGYFYVSFYDRSGKLMYSQLMPLPSVASGEEVICSTLIPKEDYPTGYSSVKYTQSVFTKD